MRPHPKPDRGQHPADRREPTAPPGAASSGLRFSLLGLLIGVGMLGALAALARRLIQSSEGPAETAQLTFVGWVIFVPLVPALALLAAVGWYEFSRWRRRAEGRKRPRE